MKHVKTFGSVNQEKIFHCYIPYTDKKLFTIAVDSLNIDKKLKNDIITYLYTDGYFTDTRWIGCFLRFNLPNWDFYQLDSNDEFNVKVISDLLKDTQYNIDDLQTQLKKGVSKYIGKIKLSKKEIELYDDTNKYNL